MPSTILDQDFKEPRFEVYDRFHNVADTEYLISLLKKAKIPYQVEQPPRVADAIFTGEGFIPQIFIRVHFNDFKKINQLIEQDTLRLIQENKIDLSEHYFHEFSNEELVEVIRKPEEWNFDTVAIARHLLHQRGVNYDEQQIADLKNEGLTALRIPKKANPFGMVTLFIIGLVGGFYWHFICLLIAAPMGYYYWRTTSIDPNGDRFYTFDRPSRKLGSILLFFTIAVFVLRLMSIFLKSE